MRPIFRAACLVLFAAAGAARPAAAAPPLTLRLENVSFHEVLQRLEQHYGWRVRSTGGPGGRDYQPPEAAPRASFDWRDAAVGIVFRDVAAAFGQTPHAGRGPAVLFRPAVPAPAVLTLNRDGAAISLREVSQNERISRAEGAGTTEVTREAALSFVIRPLDGDPDSIYGLEQLRARDDRGRELRAADGLRRAGGEATGLIPDEWPVVVRFPGIPGGARRLERVEGELVLYRSVRSGRIEVPLGQCGEQREWRVGPVGLRGVSVTLEERRLRGRFLLAWPFGTELLGPDGDEPARMWPAARGRSGALVRIPASVVELGSAGGERTALVELRPVALPEEPVALVWDLTARAHPERRVPFRLERVPLPFALAAPPSPGVGPAASRLAGLAVRVLRQGEPWTGELAVGLARRAGGGWGPIRWLTAETDERGEARLEGLEPGAYRVLLKFRPRGPRGALGAQVPLSARSAAPVELAPGRVARLDAARAAR